jgi:hypothetical protein
MSPPVFLAGLFIVFGLGPLSFALSGAAKRWFAYKEQAARILGEQTAERAAQYAAKVERLEARMAVLERILTDRGTALADEIDRLRLPADN